MIVFDASALVGAALKIDSVPERALFHAAARDAFALSAPVDAEISEVLSRPKFARLISRERRQGILSVLRSGASWFEPTVPVTDCRDPDDNIYLELALASRAEIIVSSDDDLLVLHPWRGVRILNPASYVTLA